MGSLFPIDIVYTWVDGSDAEWVSRNAQALVSHGFSSPSGSNRFANHDELMYSIRSVERFMPWVRRIHIVTDQQVPSWLSHDNPQVRIVDHTQIFLKGSRLPCFNSMAIESNLHRIPGLSERYIYFNDDMMIGSPMEPEDFFAPDGRPYSFLFGSGLSRLRREIRAVLPGVYRYAQLFFLYGWMRRNYAEKHQYIVKQHYNRISMIRHLRRPIPVYKTRHTPIPLTRTMAQAMEDLYRDEYEKCRTHPFRSKDDLFLPELYATTGIIRKFSVKRYLDFSELYYHKLGIAGAPQFSRLRAGRYRFISVNDDSGASDGTEIEAYHMAMREMFPEPSSFERIEVVSASL